MELAGCDGEKAPERNAWKMYTGLSALGAGLILGGVGTSQAVLGHDRRNSAALSIDEVERDVLISKAEYSENIAYWTLGAGIPLVLVGVILTAIDGAEAIAVKKGRNSSLSVLPAVGGDGSVGLVLETKF